MTSKEALEKIDHTICLAFNENNNALFGKDKYDHIDCKDIDEFVDCYDIIEKDLEVLEIIKNKKVNLEYLKCCDIYEQYKTICSYWDEITETEFNLIKEWLCEK